MVTKTLAKFNLGERVRVKLFVKTDFPAVGYIKRASLRLGKVRYLVRFDRGLFKKPLLQQVYEVEVLEEQIKREDD